MISRQFLRIVGLVAVAGLFSVLIGNGCAKEFITESSNTSLRSTGLNLVGSGTTTSNDIPVIPGAKTASLVYSNQVLSHMTACVGVAKPSDATVQMYELKRGAISVYGTANTITSPMMMAVTSIAGEVCNDLINQEQTTKRIFQGIDFASNTLPSDGVLSDIIVRMSLSCWQRNETSTERQKLLDMVVSSIGATEPQAQRKASLMLCTAMLSSLDALMN